MATSTRGYGRHVGRIWGFFFWCGSHFSGEPPLGPGWRWQEIVWFQSNLELIRGEMDAQRSKWLTQGHPFVGSREAVPELSPPHSLSRALPITPPKSQIEGHQTFPRDSGPSGLRGFPLKSLLFQWANNAQGGSLLTVPSWGCREEFTTSSTLGLLRLLRRSVRKGLVMLTLPVTSFHTQWFMQKEVGLQLCHKTPSRFIQTVAQPGAEAMHRGLQSCASGRERPLPALLTGVKHCPCIGDSLIINCYSFLLYF